MNITEFLIHPVNGHPLEAKADGSLHPADPGEFTARKEGNLVTFLPKGDAGLRAESAFHQKHGSEFRYREHYEKDAEFFDYFSEQESRLVRDENRRLRQKIAAAVPLSAQIILDVGCGGGWLSRKLVSNTKSVISMDVSTGNPTRVLCELPHENHAGLVADVYNLPLADECLDVIVAAEIMEHLPDPALFIECLLRPLKKGGKLIITTPYKQKIKYHLCVHCDLPTPLSGHLHSISEENVPAFVPRGVSELRMETFMNAYFVKTRLSLLLAFLPYPVWKLADRLWNSLLRRPLRFMMQITK